MTCDLGLRIRAMREYSRMTREELASCVNLSVSYIGLVERGIRTPSLPKLLEICDVLNTTLDYLIRGSGHRLKVGQFLEPSASDGSGSEKSQIIVLNYTTSKKEEFIRTIQNIIAVYDFGENVYKFFISMLSGVAELASKDVL